MFEDRLLRFSEMCEQMAKEARAMVIAIQLEGGQTATAGPALDRTAPKASPPQLPEPPMAIVKNLPDRTSSPRRHEDSLIRLVEFGYIYEGTRITLIPRMIPPGAKSDNPIFHARIDRNPSKPVWEATGEPVRSLTALSKILRDDWGVSLPQSSFNPCNYWCICGEPPERTLASIARQIVL